MKSVQVIKVHRIDVLPGTSDIRLVVDITFGLVTFQALIVVPFPNRVQAARALEAIVEAVAPEMDGPVPYQQTEVMPDGETLVVHEGRIFPGRRKGDPNP